MRSKLLYIYDVSKILGPTSRGSYSHQSEGKSPHECTIFSSNETLHPTINTLTMY
jgi:hypothetical protein